MARKQKGKKDKKKERVPTPDEKKRRRSIRDTARAIGGVLKAVTSDSVARVRHIPDDEWKAAVEQEES